jgi:hypothetical protein
MNKWILLLLVAVLPGCSVKEDRGFCPAWCVVYSDGYVAEGCAGSLSCNVATDAQGSLDFGCREFSSFARRGELVLEVPRGELVYVDVFCGVEEMELNGSVLAIPMGCCSDCIYSGHGSLFISGEEGEAGLPLNKDYSRLLLKVKGVVPDDNPFWFRILGNVDGYVLPGGKPHRGEFDYSPPEEPGCVFAARLPRQLDDSLLLEIYHKDDGSLVTRQELGRMIKDLGYDWSAPDLKDIALGVDLSAASFTIEVEAWDISETIKITM